MAMTSHDLAGELQELIAALDRRVPRVEQAGEIGIARDAAALREKAVDRLRQLGGKSTAADPQTSDRQSASRRTDEEPR